MFIMLKRSARSLFTRKGKWRRTFEEVFNLLRTRFNYTDKESRLLAEWHDMTFKNAMQKIQDGSEITVFRSFGSNLTSLQYQLHENYHTDWYLRDQLMTYIDIPNIRDTLKDRVPRTSHQIVRRVASTLYNKKNSSESAAYLADKYRHPDVGLNHNENEDMYSLGQNYGGEAVKRWRDMEREVTERIRLTKGINHTIA